MKKLFVLVRNHMDPSWRRCFEEHFSYEQGIIRPYADIEEAQIGQYVMFAEKYGLVYSIEQTISIKKYLQRNPDMLGRIQKLVLSGNIEILGGGETVIDTNIPNGESLIRNHYYSIKYLQDAFGVRPKYVDLIDVFGLSAQLPQILRQFGYDAITNFCRVFQDNKPYWKGLDGSLIMFADLEGDKQDGFFCDTYKYPYCTACHGEGCAHCGHTGLDYSYVFPIDSDNLCDNTLSKVLAEIDNSKKDELVLTILSEETLHSDDFIDILKKKAADLGLTLIFTSYADLLEKKAFHTLAALRENRVPQKDIDVRVEGNPMAPGCYTSRIEIKKQNRQLESMLFSSETLAALAFDQGTKQYPVKKFEYLWNKMAFIQFHDCITASHTDASYEELCKYCREVKLGAAQIYQDAANELLKNITVPERAGYTPFILFNTENIPAENIPLSATVRLKDHNCTDNAIEITDCEGRIVDIINHYTVKNTCAASVDIRFIGSLPKFGHAVFYYRTVDQMPIRQPCLNQMENEYYRIRYTDSGVVDIYDKKLQTVILKDNPGSVSLSSDVGHPWGRVKPEEQILRLHPHMVYAQTNDRQSILHISGSCHMPEREIDRLAFNQTISLYSGNPNIYFHTKIDFNGKNIRVTAHFPLGFTPEESALYEIPFGTVRRNNTIISTDQLGIEDEWPAQNWFASTAQDKSVSVILYNKGLPGCRIKDGAMQISLLRSPYDRFYAYACEGAVDNGIHEYEFAVSSCAGTPGNIRPVETGRLYNAFISTVPAVCKTGKLPPVFSYGCNSNSHVVLSACKRDCNGHIIQRYYEAYGENADDTMYSDCEITDLLEERHETSGRKIEYKPFEIKTIRILGDV